MSDPSRTSSPRLAAVLVVCVAGVAARVQAQPDGGAGARSIAAQDDAAATAPAPVDEALEPAIVPDTEALEAGTRDAGDDEPGLAVDPQSGEPVAPAEEDDPPPEDKPFAIIGFPFAFYLPETNFGFGLGVTMSMRIRRPEESSRYRWFRSNFTIGGAYTLNRQARLVLTPEFYLGPRIVVDGQTEFRHYPDRYYGLGRASDPNYQTYLERTIRSVTAVRYQVLSNFYAGGVLDVAVTDVDRPAQKDLAGNERPDAPDDNWLGTGAVAGESGSLVAGAGVSVVYDTRENPLMTKSGYFARLHALVYPNIEGRTSRYGRITVDTRAFYPFHDGDLVLALQAVASIVVGDAPFNHLASAGGPVGMRSLPDGRYRDAVHSYAQAEFRFPIVWRFRGMVNLAAGSVFGPNSQDRPAQLAWGAGFGVRIVLVPERRLSVRGDLIFGAEGVRPIGFVHEAF